jgi:hypothetical protein
MLEKMSDSEKVLLNFIIKTFIQLINSTDMMQNQSLMQKFQSKVVEIGIFKNRATGRYFQRRFINRMINGDSICKQEYCIESLKLDNGSDGKERNKAEFLRYLRQFKKVSKKYITINNIDTYEEKKPVKFLKMIKAKDLEQSVLFRNNFGLYEFYKDIESYQIFIYRMMKEVSQWIQETDLMMPTNKALRDRVFKRLNQIILHNKETAGQTVIPECISIIYSELEKAFKLSPELRYLFSSIDMDDTGVNLQIYAEFYSYFLVKTYPNIKIRGRYKPLKTSGKTILPMELDHSYDSQIVDLIGSISNSKGNPKSLKKIADMIHELFVTTTFLDDKLLDGRDRFHEIFFIIEDNSYEIKDKLEKYLLKNLLQLAIERGYLNQSEAFKLMEDPYVSYVKIREGYRNIINSKEIFEVLPKPYGF